MTQKKTLAFLLAAIMLLLPFSASIAASKSVKFKVTATCTLKTKNHHVGDEWSIIHEFNEKKYFKTAKSVSKPGTESISLTQGETLVIRTTVIEDEKYPDVGEETRKHKITASDIKNGFTETLKIKVTEDRGKYAGESVEWEVVYEFKP